MPATTDAHDLCDPVVSLRLRDDPRAPGRVRAVLREVFRAWMVDEDAGSDGVVMASELVTNALTHAPGPYGLDVWARGAPDGTPSLRCAVSDGGPPVPLFDRAEAAAETDPAAAGGRGLLLVRRWSAGRCGIRPLAPGKAVWFAVAIA